MRSLLILILISSFLCRPFAQSGTYTLGARSTGLAGASISIADEYSLFNNVGAMGRVSSSALFAGYQSRYGISEFQVVNGGALYHHRIGTAGIGYFKSGDSRFSEQHIHLAVGNQIQKVSLGLAVDVIQYTIESIGVMRVVVIEFGGLIELTPQLFLGAQLFNLAQAELNREPSDPIPTTMKAGISYRPTQELMLNMEVEKDLDFPEILKVGIEYRIIKDCYLRTGIKAKPFYGAYGIGFYPGRYKFDYALSNNVDLGNVHELSLAYRVGK